ncbi:MAG: hypothetical protein DHS20C17_26130 [Cyclobacteriaceae bacterium]|nr:MAG: hypothetical protein DHS20C17_26130 [Cyclobacteriaceae bacterium]
MKGLILIALSAIAAFAFQGVYTEIPKTWDIGAIEESHLPPPDPSVEVQYAPEEYYNSLPEHVIYKTYLRYAEGYQPEGYLDSLHSLEPEIVFDVNKIKTQQDWIEAGKEVFFWPVSGTAKVDPQYRGIENTYLVESGDPITAEGVYPFSRYLIQEKGKVLRGTLSCATCHTRVMSDGSTVIGAQGNTAFDPGFAVGIVEKFKVPKENLDPGMYSLISTPWAPEVKQRVTSRTRDEFVADLMASPNGVMVRQGVGFLPVSVPSLIGIKDIKYLDKTGLMIHEGPEDLMRYAALNQGMDMLTSYNGFIPLGTDEFTQLPTPNEWNHPFGYAGKRYSDEQLYALAQYIYSLTPPENPNIAAPELLAKGERIFIEQGCVTCHTPPIYTNNMLTPVDGFTPPESHFEKYDIFDISVETDTDLSLKARRGTGYYKIPSLRGVWYRQNFFHNGELATLEDIFDPARLKDDYVPTGYKLSTVTSKSVPGHDFGMELNDGDKSALISFLKSL